MCEQSAPVACFIFFVVIFEIIKRDFMYIKCDATFHFACVEFILYRQTTEKPRNTLEANILPSLGIFFVILWVHEQASSLSFPAAFNPFIKANHNSMRKELGITKKTHGRQRSIPPERWKARIMRRTTFFGVDQHVPKSIHRAMWCRSRQCVRSMCSILWHSLF